MKHPHILIIEDEPVVAGAATDVLSSEGIRVERVADAEAALAKLEASAFQLIILDIMLPGMSGFEFLELAKRKYPDVEVVTISGYATVENSVRSFKLGAFDFIPKPFDFEELLSVVRRAIAFAEQPSNFGNSEKAGIPGALVKDDLEGFYFLGGHTWARIDRDGSGKIGVGETFAGVSGDLDRIEFPEMQEIGQGAVCARILTRDPLLHIVRSPLTGRVIERNAAVMENVNLINTDPFHQGWLVRIIPTHPEPELANLRQGLDSRI